MFHYKMWPLEGENLKFLVAIKRYNQWMEKKLQDIENFELKNLD